MSRLQEAIIEDCTAKTKYTLFSYGKTSGGEVVIGRALDGQIYIPENLERSKCVSKHHAGMVLGEDGFMIRDNNSKHGTRLVNRDTFKLEKVSSKHYEPLCHHDVFFLGPYGPLIYSETRS